MKTITVNYRNHTPKTFQYDILNDINVDIKYKKFRGDMCVGTSNGESFSMAWGEWCNGDRFLNDWTNDSQGAPKEIEYSGHVIEALMRFFGH